MGVEFAPLLFVVSFFGGQQEDRNFNAEGCNFSASCWPSLSLEEATARISCVMKNRKINRRARTQKHTGRFDFFIRLMSKSRSKIKIGGTLLVFFFFSKWETGVKHPLLLLFWLLLLLL
jgi:hypothetical protein